MAGVWSLYMWNCERFFARGFLSGVITVCVCVCGARVRVA